MLLNSVTADGTLFKRADSFSHALGSLPANSVPSLNDEVKALTYHLSDLKVSEKSIRQAIPKDLQDAYTRTKNCTRYFVKRIVLFQGALCNMLVGIDSEGKHYALIAWDPFETYVWTPRII